jgi:sigma-B regulation protein RsbQ
MDIVTKNNVNILGKGSKTIIFSHGFGCDQHMWRLVTPYFTENYKVVLFDHVGAGNSDTSAYNYSRYNSLQGYAQDVLAICHDLDLSEVIFVGHSVSAMIGVLAAVREPSLFEKLVLVGPSPCYINDKDKSYEGGFSREDIEGLIESLESNYLGWSSMIAPIIMANGDRPELGQELANSFCKTDPEIAQHFARTTFLSDNRADLKKLKTKTLILQCSEDIIAPMQVGKYVHEQLPDSTLHVLAATGHCPNLSAPQETSMAILQYLN